MPVLASYIYQAGLPEWLNRLKLNQLSTWWQPYELANLLNKRQF